jgi:hypothetical protein
MLLHTARRYRRRTRARVFVLALWVRLARPAGTTGAANVTRLPSARLLTSGTWAQQTEAIVRNKLAGANETDREPYLTLAKNSRVLGTRHKSACSKLRVQSSGEEGAIWLELAAMARARAFSVGSGTLEKVEL